MAIGKQAALTGVAGRIAGRRATRAQAMAAAMGAAFLTYRLLRSGADADEDDGEAD